MANPDPSPSTRFGAENGNKPGRKHTKDKLSQAFLKDLQEVWDEHGKAVLERMAGADNPQGNAALAKIAASLEPKELEITRPLDGVTDDELADLIDLVRAKQSPTAVN